MHNTGATQRRRLIYIGRVQGVGFRFTTASIARRHPVAGFVRNLTDGTVELVAEGLGTAVDRFLGEIAATFESNIKECRTLPVDESEQFNGFEVRY